MIRAYVSIVRAQDFDYRKDREGVANVGHAGCSHSIRDNRWRSALGRSSKDQSLDISFDTAAIRAKEPNPRCKFSASRLRSINDFLIMARFANDDRGCQNFVQSWKCNGVLLEDRSRHE